MDPCRSKKVIGVSKTKMDRVESDLQNMLNGKKGRLEIKTADGRYMAVTVKVNGPQ